MNYQPPLGDIEHVFFNVLKGAGQMQALGPFAETDADLMRQVISEAGKFVAQRIAPLQRDGDEIGGTWAGGAVTTPPGFRAAYRAFWQAGWPALACATEDGGQGLPAILEAVLFEILCGANHGWTMAPGLLHGAYECIRHHGSEALKKTYLEKVATGEWLATMCLTEPHAGSDFDGGRVLAYRTAIALELVKHHPDTGRRDSAQRWCALVTPVLKAALTHQAFYGASECLQVFGGHGYVRVVALALTGWAWVQIQAAPAITESQVDNPARWTAPAEALQSWVLPEFDMRVGIIRRRMVFQ